ncbi:MAG: MBOAT family protein [Lachnospiraceae bacterium]|nr:MBOAT family protein [Lachnospiraceae bacterium]
MQFTSLPFLIFFPVVVLIYFVIPHRFRYLWLLFCSYFFYACQDGSATVLLMVSTVITWSAGRLVYKADSVWMKNLYVGMGFFLNLIILLYFKYSGAVAALFGIGTGFGLLLPAGISFYTFQSLTYIMDCYREEVKPQNNLLKYALFVSFFPCILSGPIERAKNILPQIDEEHKWDSIRAKEGLFLMLWGAFLKLVIVSRLEILTDYVYSGKGPALNAQSIQTGGIQAGGLCGIPMIIAMFAYSFLIYCDFAGYSFMAVGAARVMGFNVMRNFRQPYLSVSVADFWRRWHISLSTWFRDYLYIPLGGSRRGTLKRYLNIMIVFAVSGIWHGATMNFLIWGLLYGIYQVIGYAARPLKDKASAVSRINRHTAVKRLLCNAFTFVLVSVTWIFFRSANVLTAVDEIGRTFRGIRVSELFDGTLTRLGLGTMNLLFVAVALVILILVDIMCEKKNKEVFSLMDNTPAGIRWCVYYLLMVMILFSCNLSTQEFLYQGF